MIYQMSNLRVLIMFRGKKHQWIYIINYTEKTRNIVIGQRLVINPKRDIYQEAHLGMYPQKTMMRKKIQRTIPMKIIKNNYLCFLLTYKK